MKVLRNMLLVCLISFSSVSFAVEIDYDAQIKILDSAALALHQYHPDMSKELSQYAHDQALWKDETEVNKQEAEAEKKEILTKEKKIDHIQLLRDSAELLQHSNPELSTALITLADRKSKNILGASAPKK